MHENANCIIRSFAHGTSLAHEISLQYIRIQTMRSNTGTVLKRLHSRNISRVDTNALHASIYKESHCTLADEWVDILDTAYIWYDWISMSYEESSSSSSQLRSQSPTPVVNSLKLLPMYIARSDFVSVVSPGCLHADRTLDMRHLFF